MKQIIQNYKKGTLYLEEVPIPVCRPNGVLVKTLYSAVSVGTEKMKLRNASMNYLQMARSKPEQVKQIMTTLKQLGPVDTYRKVMNKLDSMTPLGYSCVGEVIEVGNKCPDVKAGDIVACAGGGYANHAEFNYIPKNLFAHVPKEVDMESAAFTTIAAIALQGFRQAQAQVGEYIAVLGLGLIGQILIQIINAAGCQAIGFDINESKNRLALDNGALWAGKPDMKIAENVVQLTSGYGADKIILTASTKSNMPVDFAAAIARDRACVVDIGITKMNIPWEPYYRKEMDLRLSRSYGPGRYDPSYEEKGIDYPVGYVRWTEQRNLKAILKLLERKKLNFNKLITHRFPFRDALSAYNKIEKGEDDFLGVIFQYDSNYTKPKSTMKIKTKPVSSESVCIGVIGAGNFAKTTLLLHLKNKNLVLATIADLTSTAAKDCAIKFGFQKASTDYKDILNDSDIETVMILTRHASHSSLVRKALNSGKNVYVEKPLCVNTDDLVPIENALLGSKKTLMVGYNRRFSPAIKKLKTLLNRFNVPSVIHYRANAGFLPKDHWYHQLENGGRIIGEACHFIDTLQFLTDEEPVAVSAMAVNSEDVSMPDEDNLVATIQFNKGSIGVVEYLSDGDKSYPKEQITITAGRSNIFFYNFKYIKHFYNGKKKKYSGFHGKGHKEEMKIFIESLISGNMPISWKSLKLTSLTTQAVIDSYRSGKRIFLK